MKETKSIDVEKRGLPTSILRTLYIASIALTTSGNVYLVGNGYSDGSLYLLAIASVIMSILMIIFFSKLQGNAEFKQFDDNLKESHRLVLEIENKSMPFLARRNAMRLDNYSSSKVIESPLNWILGVFVFWIFFTTETYTKFDFNDPEKWMLLILMTLMQLIMLSSAISGMIIVFYKKIKSFNSR